MGSVIPGVDSKGASLVCPEGGLVTPRGRLKEGTAGEAGKESGEMGKVRHKKHILGVCGVGE